MDGDPGVRGLEVRVARLEARVGDLEAELNVRRSEHATGPETARAAPPPPPARAIASSRTTPVPDHALHPVPPVPRREPVPAQPAAALWSAPAVGEGTPEPLAAWPRQAPVVRGRPAIDLRDIEERFAGQALAWIGGLALVAAAVFFLSLAFSRGWITEPMRVAIGFAVAAAALAAGTLSFDRRNPLLGDVLTAAGLGIASITLFAATRGYGLLAPEVGLLAALVAAIAAALIAIRYDAREVAAFGLVAALIAPPVMGASATLLTLLFVAVTLVGTTAIALFRSWRWLPTTAFVLAAPQLASWLLGRPDLAQALVALAGFWLVNIVAAGGEEVRIRRDDLRPSSATLTLANAAYLLWGGFTVLTGPSHEWLGAFVAVASIAHLAVGGTFLRRQGLEHLFGNLVAGTGVALVALAAFIQLGAALVPVAWAAEAAALVWLASRRLHRWSALAALALGFLAVCHILAVEYPLDRLSVDGPFFATPLLHPEAATLVAVILAVAVAGWFARVAWVRSALAAVGAGLLGYAALFETSGPVLTAALVVVALVALALDAGIEAGGTRPDLARLGAAVSDVWFASAVALALGAVAAGILFGVGYHIGFERPAVPYTDPAAGSLGIILAGLAVTGAVFATRPIRSAMGAVAVALVAWSAWFELGDTAAIALCAALLPVAVIGDLGLARLADAPRLRFLRLPREASGLMGLAGSLAWLGALTDALVGRLGVLGWSGGPHRPVVPFTDETALVAFVLAGSAIAAAAWVPWRPARQLALLGALVPVACAIPLEVGADVAVVLWLPLAAAALAVTRPSDELRPVSGMLAALLGLVAVGVAFGIVAPPDRLWVAQGGGGGARVALLAGWPLALAAVAVAVLAAARRPWLVAYRPHLEVAAAAVGVYLVSLAAVYPFDRMVGGATATEELAKQAQVVMSVAWTAIGALALGVGLRSRWAMPRHIGFGLLALATLKVFTVDLAAMDVAYRALVLAGLGVLLLVSAWLFTHLRGPRAGTPGGPRIHGVRPAG